MVKLTTFSKYRGVDKGVRKIDIFSFNSESSDGYKIFLQMYINLKGYGLNIKISNNFLHNKKKVFFSLDVSFCA